ncbi:hypothetical protein ACFYOK_29575 [Microbispora bryophytorum]|uniref:hypothetical protein n=1 Tax=Microbispora bryophytorum TaxID=1460882 RepID=UPI0033FF1C45
MSLFEERYTERTQLGWPEPGPSETANAQHPARVAIMRGGRVRLEWFHDPAELAALEAAAHTARLRLEQMQADQRAAEQGTTGQPDSGHLDVARPYIPVATGPQSLPGAPTAQPAGAEGEAPGPRAVAARP